MRKTSEQEWEPIASDEGLSFDDNSLGNVSSDSSQCSSISDISSNEPGECAEVHNHPVMPALPENKSKKNVKGDNILEILRQVTETVQRLERKVDNMQTILTDLTRGRTVRTCLHCKPSILEKNVSQIKKNFKRDGSAKKKALTWRSGLGLPVTSVAEMNSVNQKLNTNEYLTEFKTLLRHCSSRGIGLNEKLKLILKEALGNEIGGLYNLSGTCGKRSIEKTELFNSIQCYVMELYGATNETRRAVKLVFHRFLKNQQDRITKAAKCKSTEPGSSAGDSCNGESSTSNSGTLPDKTADVLKSEHDNGLLSNKNSFNLIGRIIEKGVHQCDFCDEAFSNEALLKEHICNYIDAHDVDDDLDSNADDSSYERGIRKFLLYDSVAWVDDASSPLIDENDLLPKGDELLKMDDCDDDLIDVGNRILNEDPLSIFRVKKERVGFNASRIFANEPSLDCIDDDLSDS